MRFDVYVHFDVLQAGDVAARLTAIEGKLDGLITGVKTMSEQLTKLTQEVQEIGGVVDSAVTLINGLAAQIVALKDDPAALQALADSLDAKAGELAAAVAANTPAPV